MPRKIAGFRFVRTEACQEPDDIRPPHDVEVYAADHGGAEFVLVPGTERVTLGWSGGLNGLDPKLIELLDDDFYRVLHPAEGYRHCP
jgi:hypothetical protein